MLRTAYLTHMKRLKRKRIIFVTLAIFLAFWLGMYLAAVNHVAQSFSYDGGQALALLPVPIDAYQPELELPEPATTYLGTYTVTAYCACEICCGKWSNPDNPLTASGTTPAELITVGADWDKLPPGTGIYIDGVGSRIVEDKPAKWIVDKYDGKIIDLFMYSHSDAMDFGKRELDVWEVR